MRAHACFAWAPAEQVADRTECAEFERPGAPLPTWQGTLLKPQGALPRTRTGRSVPDAHAVGDLLGRFLLDRNLELERMAFDLLEPVRAVEHRPVAGHRLDHGDRLLLALVVAQRDLPLDLVDIRRDLPPLLLRALANHVERVA